ncbi:MAG: hypothetical protein NW226_22575 [Microscillaceae bacterium]|nr:hypothetical protein [Microscillaceae bacterium]
MIRHIEFKIPDIEFFENLIQINKNGLDIDLHNDYSCTQVLFNDNDSSLKIYFISDSDKMNRLELIFKNVIILKINFVVSNVLTLDNFSRCKIENDEKLFDYDENGRSLFILEFVEGQEIEVLSKEIFICTPPRSPEND